MYDSVCHHNYFILDFILEYEMEGHHIKLPWIIDFDLRVLVISVACCIFYCL